jgi:hypothetical protein
LGSGAAGDIGGSHGGFDFAPWNSRTSTARGAAGWGQRAFDYDDFGLILSKIVTVTDFESLERDAAGNRFLLPHSALVMRKGSLDKLTSGGAGIISLSWLYGRY